MQQRQDKIIYILKGIQISERFLSKSSFFFSSLGLPCPAWPLAPNLEVVSITCLLYLEALLSRAETARQVEEN